MDAETPNFTIARQISTDYLINVCKYRQRKECCRYIYYPREKREFYCVKTISEMKEKLDNEVSTMTAQGDNCPGLPNEKS